MLMVGTRQLMNQMESSVNINFMGKNRIPVAEVKDLGMLLDPHLTYDKHIQALSSSCISKLGQIGQVKPNFDPTSQGRASVLPTLGCGEDPGSGWSRDTSKLPKSGTFLISVLYAIKGGVAKYNMSLSCMSEPLKMPKRNN